MNRPRAFALAIVVLVGLLASIMVMPGGPLAFDVIIAVVLILLLLKPGA
jgi:hypothetical protein